MEIEREISADGAIRHVRIFHPKKVKILNSKGSGASQALKVPVRSGKNEDSGKILNSNSVSQSDPRVYIYSRASLGHDQNPELGSFEITYNHLTEEYFGKIIPLFGRKRSERKLSYVHRILENLKAFGVPADLFLRSQFEIARSKPRVLFLNALASEHAIRRYRNWIAKFPTLAAARAHFQDLDFEEVLEKNHRKFIYYRDTLGFDEETVLKTRAVEFSPFYLLTFPQFPQILKNNPETLPSEYGERFSKASEELYEDPQIVQDFWKLARGVKGEL